MTAQSCQGCSHYQPSLVYKMACFRSKAMKSGRTLKAPVGVGFPAEFEATDAALYDDRADRDGCGSQRIHYSTGEGAA